MTWIEAPAMPENGHSPPSLATAPVVDSTSDRAPLIVPEGALPIPSPSRRLRRNRGCCMQGMEPARRGDGSGEISLHVPMDQKGHYLGGAV
jgi:hypothetical protein